MLKKLSLHRSDEKKMRNYSKVLGLIVVDDLSRI